MKRRFPLSVLAGLAMSVLVLGATVADEPCREVQKRVTEALARIDRLLEKANALQADGKLAEAGEVLVACRAAMVELRPFLAKPDGEEATGESQPRAIQALEQLKCEGTCPVDGQLVEEQDLEAGTFLQLVAKVRQVEGGKEGAEAAKPAAPAENKDEAAAKPAETPVPPQADAANTERIRERRQEVMRKFAERRAQTANAAANPREMIQRMKQYAQQVREQAAKAAEGNDADQAFELIQQAEMIEDQIAQFAKKAREAGADSPPAFNPKSGPAGFDMPQDPADKARLAARLLMAAGMKEEAQQVAKKIEGRFGSSNQNVDQLRRENENLRAGMRKLEAQLKEARGQGDKKEKKIDESAKKKEPAANPKEKKVGDGASQEEKRLANEKRLAKQKLDAEAKRLAKEKRQAERQRRLEERKKGKGTEEGRPKVEPNPEPVKEL